MKFFKYLSIFVTCLSLTGCSKLNINIDAEDILKDLQHIDGNYNDYDNNNTLAKEDDYWVLFASGPNVKENGKSLEYKAKTLKGNFLVAQADIKEDCEYSFSLDISADVGKAKLILVKPDNTIEILKEVIASSENKFNGNISFHCNIGLNRIKFVGSNFKGQFKLTQTDNLFDFVEFSVFDDIHDDLEESIEDELKNIEDILENQKHVINNTVKIEQTKADVNLIEKTLNSLRNRIKHIFEHSVNSFKLLKFKFLFI